jgi:hypothetical protein
MSKIYKDSDFTLLLDTQTNLVGATVSILYQSPSGLTGEWAGTVDSTTKISISISKEVNGEAGEWYIQGKVLLAGKTYKTDALRMTVYELKSAKWPNYNGNSIN